MIENPQIYISEDLRERIIALSSISNLSNQFDLLLNFDYSKLSPTEVFNLLSDTLIYFPFQTSYTRPYTIDKFPIFRIRTNIDDTIENLKLVRTYSYPNSSFCKENGRANLKFNPVFYCSDEASTAFLETQPKVGDIAYLSEWLIRCPRACAYMYFFPTQLKNNNPWRFMASRQYAIVYNFFKVEFGEETTKKIKSIIDFIAKIYVDENAPYHLTSALSHTYLYNDIGYDFIIYPSNKTDSGTCNFAFNPNFVDEFFKLDKVSKMKVFALKDSKAEVQILLIGEYSGNNVIWRKPLDEDLPFLSKIT